MLVTIGNMISVIGIMIGLYIISKVIYLARQKNAGMLFTVFGIITVVFALIGIILLIVSSFDLIETGNSISRGMNIYKGY